MTGFLFFVMQKVICVHSCIIALHSSFCLVISLFRRIFTVTLWFSICGQNEDVTKCFPSDCISSYDTGKKYVIT